MPFIQQADAEKITRPYFDDFVAIARGAWADWMASPIAPQMQRKTVRANYVWNQLLAIAKRRFEGRDGVRVETFKDWDGVLINEKIFVRMKKGSTVLRSCNYPTQTALAFNDATQDLFGGIARLDLLYVLNKAETEIERVALVQRHKSTVAWFIDLLDDSAAPAQQNTMPLIPQLPQGSAAGRMVKPKEEKKTHGKREPRSGS